MYILKVDFDKCNNYKFCGICESLLPRFMTVWGGLLPIKNTLQEEEIYAAANRVKAACPNDAILLDTYKGK